jgi:hypothetical protein
MFVAPATAQPHTDQRLVFVMLDGLRWQEVFRGADPELAAQAEYMRSPWAASVRKRFIDTPDRRAALTPFLTNVVAREGALVGDRDHGSCARVTNPMWFSYPGYNEALTGKADPQINSNDFGPNPNVTFLEWLNRRPDFRGRVRAITSWDAFPRIINAERSGVPVNAGFAPAEEAGDAGMRMLNRLLADTAHPFDIVRLDSFTHRIALDALNHHAAHALFISYGETDDFAHEGDYAQYLISANRTDRFLREIWETLQRDRRYAGRTTMIVTVDHGRGDRADASWRHHSSGAALRASGSALGEQYPDGIPGSDQTWIAAIGPGVRAGEALAAQSACAGLDQIASTALSALGIDWRTFNPDAGAPLPIFRTDSAP